MTHRATIEYQPALDGVRAMAVAVVLLFHAEVPGFSGGYLGVSVFFTLSGYLITSLLLAEHATTGSISFSGFYARRVRRLLPASLACLSGIVLVSVISEVFVGVVELRRQVIGALLQVSNWVFLAGESSYQQLFQQTGGTQSPVEHFWSLSIEEQFYWVWPPTMALILGRCATRRGRTLALGSLTLAFALAAPLIAWWFGPDAAYWATPARVGEILIGALLALVVRERRVPQRAAWLAPAALVALGICVVTFPAAGGPAYEGWLPVVAIGTALLILGLQPASPLRRAVASRPLVWLGGISYGVYLYHWPVFVIADESRTGLDGWQLVVFQIGVTVVLAQVSYALLEQPIRSLRRAPRRPTLILGATATAAVASMAIVTVPGALGEYWQTDNATVEAAAIEVDDDALEPLAIATTTFVPTTVAPTSTTTPPTVVPSPTVAATSTTTTSTTSTTSTTTSTTEAPLPALSRPVRIVVAGDSTARATAAGLLTWAAENPDLAQVEVVAAPGCGFLRGGERRESGFRPPPDECARWLGEELPGRVSETLPDVVMMMVTTWDVVDHRWDDGHELTPLDPDFQRRLGDDYAAVTEQLLGAGAGSIAWIDPPVPNVWWGGQGTGQEDPTRHAVVRGEVEELAASRPGDVGVIDLAGWLDDAGLTDDRHVRPDGVHFDPEAALGVAEQFLGERLVRVALG